MTLRIVALILAVLLVLPAAVILLRPGRDAGDGPRTRRLSLDGLWTVVPIVLLVALIALAAAA